MSLGMPPTLMILESRHTATEWSAADKKLAMAWTILQRETCGQCGQPLWICRSSNNQLSFSVRKGTCYAKAALDKWAEGPNGTKKLKKGEHPYIVPVMRGEVPLPTRRQYQKQLQDEE